MPENEKAEKVSTLTDVPKDRVPVVTTVFFNTGATSVQSWRDPPGSDTFTVRAVFPG